MNLRDALQAIYDAHGYLTPELVVTEARPKGSPLHDIVFDKNQKDAAEAYYKARAHDLIQSVKVVYREATDDEKARSVRKWQAVRTEAGHVYKAAEDIATDPVAAAIVLADMQREWMALHRRYGAFSEFTEMVRATLTEDESSAA